MATTEASQLSERIFRFGQFELSEREGELRKNGVRIKLQEQPFRVLVELVANAGKVVSREELQQKLWPADTFVDFDVGLNTAIRKLRQALNDDAESPHYIETLARRGYRFVAQVAVTSGRQMAAENALARVGPDAMAVPNSLVQPPSPTESSNVKSTRGQLGSRFWPLVVAGAALLALAVGAVWLLRYRTPPEVVEKRVTSNPPDAPITGAVISPDGKFVAYSDPTGVYIRHIDSTETRPLDLPKGFAAVPSSWYPDGVHLLLTSYDGPHHTARIWKVSMLGGEPQMLLENAAQGLLSPDGTRMAFFRGEELTRELWIADADGQNQRGLAAPEQDRPARHRGIWSASWSPDGTRIAYVQRDTIFPNYPILDRVRVYTRKADGSDRKLVLQDSRLDSGPVGPTQVYWDPNGRLYFTLRLESHGFSWNHVLYSLAVEQETGEPKGNLQPAQHFWGWIAGFSASRTGKRLVFLRNDVSVQTYISEFAADSRKMSPPRRLVTDQEMINTPNDWTADSTSVVLAAIRNGNQGIYKQRIDSTTPELIGEPRRPSIIPPRVSPDGREVLLAEAENPEDPDSPLSLIAVPIAGGTPRLVMSQPGLYNVQCAKAPSRVCVFSTQISQMEHFYLLDLIHGKGRLVTEVSTYANWDLSPDGSTLAIVVNGEEGKLRLISIDTGMTKDVVVKDWIGLSNADWFADSKMMLMPSVTDKNVPVVLGVDRNGNATVLLEGDKRFPIYWVVSSPDGKHGAVCVETGESNVWMMEDF